MVRVQIRPSRLLAMTFALVHIGASVTVLPLDVPLEAKLALFILIAASLTQSLWHHAVLRARASIIELEVHDQERAAVRTRTGEWVDANILGTSCVTPALTVINLRVENARIPRHVLLISDNIRADDFRRIRVLLRWARPKPGKTPNAA
jgi:toxin CptA